MKIFSKRNIIVLAAVLTLAFTALGTTLALLIAKTETVTNTFTFGNINITLEETDSGLDGDNDSTTNSYKLLPGDEIAKDPKVTVDSDSEDCYLFVVLETSVGFSDLISYEVNDVFTAVQGETGVYSLEVDDTLKGTAISVLKGDKVTVFEDITKETVDNMTEFPTMKVTAYAVQKANVQDTDEAWALVEDFIANN